MFRIPEKAWPALIQFAPEQFTKLQLRFDASDTSSDEHKNVRAELERLVKAFREWAGPSLARERQAKLMALCGQTQLQRSLTENYWAKRFSDLMTIDLTATECERLMRQMFQQTKNPVKDVQEALRVLDKPWKYRDGPIGRERSET